MNDENRQHIPLAPNLAALRETGRPWDLFAQLRSVRELKTKRGDPYLLLDLADLTGAIEGKIWSNSPRAMQSAKAVTSGAVVKVRGTFKPYDGKPQIEIDQLRELEPGEQPDGLDLAQIVDPSLAAVEDLACRTLVIDIETVPAQDREQMPPSIATTLAEFASRKEPGSSKDVLDARIGMAMSLSPLFGKVVSLALGDGDAADGDVTVLAVPNPDFPVAEPPTWLRLMSEADLLRSFWALAGKAETVVTFNGRSFDLPFLVGRSLILDIPVRCDLMSQRPGQLRPHLDLFELLNQRDKAPGKLEVVCWALGVESPKGEMDGSKVAPAYARGEIVKIAEYNRHDVRATAEVFRKVRDHVLRYRKDWS